MQQADREWAMGVLGLEGSFTNEDLERATSEMKALWSPHLESAKAKAQQQGREEIEKIDRARAILESPEEAGEGDTEEVVTAPNGLKPVVLGTMVAAAFVIGFGGMYLYRVTHRRTPQVVMPKSLMASAPKVHLDAPDVSVSSRKVGEQPAEENSSLGRVNEDLAGLNGDNPYEAIDDLKAMGVTAIPGLTAALSSNDQDTRKNAAAIINLLAATAQNSEHEEDPPRYATAFQEAGTVRSLGELAEDSDDETRRMVSDAITNIGDPEGFDTLVKMSTDSSSDVRISVAKGLGRLDNSDGIPTLSAMAEDSEPSVRLEAVNALAVFKDENEAHTVLVDRLTHEDDPDVKKAIKAALGLPDIDENDL